MQKNYYPVSFATVFVFLEVCVTAPSPKVASAVGGVPSATAGTQPTAGAQSGQPATRTLAAQELAKLKAKAMSADYRADIEELTRLRDEFSKWGSDRELAYLAQYWNGFASWRMAMNGANHEMKVDELTTNLQNAATGFYSAVRLKEDFADAYAAAALVNAWLASFHIASAALPNPTSRDMAELRERMSLSRALFARASAIDPDNPRVLWAKGAFLFYTPESKGGSITRAIEVYRQMLKEAERRGVDPASPLPDWGEPEALMSIAFAHSKLTPPDLAAAREEATAALKLKPEWSYVRDQLLPKIEGQLRLER